MELKKIHLHRDVDFKNLLNKEYYESSEVDKIIKELEEGIKQRDEILDSLNIDNWRQYLEETD